MMEKYYKQDRLVKIVGRSNEASISYFKGSDLKGNTDVRLSVGVSLHQSKVVQQNLLLQLKSQGAPIEWNKIFKLLGEGDLGEELRGDIADETRAQRENQAYINGDYNKKFVEGGVELYLHDDHALHLTYHTNLAKTEEAQKWDNERWLALNTHIMEHYKIMMQLKQAMAQVGGTNAQSEANATVAGQPAPATAPAEGMTQSPESAMTEQATNL